MTSGFTLTTAAEDTVSEEGPRPVETEVAVPENAAGLARLLRAPLTQEQIDAFEQGNLVIAQLQGDDVDIIAIQPLSPGEDGCPEALFPGLILCTENAASTVSCFVEAREDCFVYTAYTLMFLTSAYDSYMPDITVRYDPAAETASVVAVESEDEVPFAQQQDYDQCYNFFRVVTAEAGKPWPQIFDMPSAGTRVLPLPMDGKPLPLCLHVPGNEYGLSYFFSIQHRDKTGYCTEPQSLPIPD